MDKNRPTSPNHPTRTTHKGKNHIGKHHTGNIILIILAALVVIGGGLAVAPFTFTKSSKTVTIRIPKDATIDNVRDSLYKYYDRDYADRVLFLAKARKIDPSKRTGAYEIKAGTSPFSTMRRLTSGAQTPVRLTFNHFRDIEGIIDGVTMKTGLSSEAFRKAATDSSMLASYGLTPKQALSLFVEDTYEVYWTSTPEEIVKKIGSNYQRLWNADNVQKAKDMNLKPAEVMIIASIVDEETNKADEKGHIGQLYINRLNQGLRLQADPTVRYALQNFSIHRITRDHLLTESPYNTYRIDGLPPGPIRTTSIATVEAILNAPSHNDLYMCAREDFSGYHNFAETYEEHIANALRYQNELDRRGIK